MKHNHPIWEGHEFNTYKTKKKCYDNTSREENDIRDLHSQEKKNSKKPTTWKQLNEWSTRPMGGLNSSLGKLNIPKENHGLANDRTGLVIDHLGDVNRYVKKESVSEFVQDVKGWAKRLKHIYR